MKTDRSKDILWYPVNKSFRQLIVVVFGVKNFFTREK